MKTARPALSSAGRASFFVAKQMTRKAIQLADLRRDLDDVDDKLSLGKTLTTQQM